MLDKRLKFKPHSGFLHCWKQCYRMYVGLGEAADPYLESCPLHLTFIYSSSLGIVIKANRRRIAVPYRLSALRKSCSYCSKSDEATCVIAGMVSIDILENKGRRLAIGESRTYRWQLVVAKNWMIQLKDGRFIGLFQMSQNVSKDMEVTVHIFNASVVITLILPIMQFRRMWKMLFLTCGGLTHTEPKRKLTPGVVVTREYRGLHVSLWKNLEGGTWRWSTVCWGRTSFGGK